MQHFSFMPCFVERLTRLKTQILPVRTYPNAKAFRAAGFRGLAALFIVALTLIGSIAVGQNLPGETSDAGTGEPELCRWRIENVQYGRIEISTDNGTRWLLVGRVLRPASGLAVNDSAPLPGSVVRSRPESLTFAVAPRRSLNLVFAPAVPRGKRSPSRLPGLSPTVRACDIITNLPAFPQNLRTLLPPVRSPVSLQTGSTTREPFVNGYMPTDNDVFVLYIPLPTSSPADPLSTVATQQEAMRYAAQTLARQYAESAAARARQEKRPVVSGTLTLNAHLPAASDAATRVAAVSYAVDNDIVAAKNFAPFRFQWDTRRVPDGEHIVEIRGLNANGSTVSRVRSLVVVQNGN